MAPHLEKGFLYVVGSQYAQGASVIKGEIMELVKS